VDHVSPTDAQRSLTITLPVGSVATPVVGRLGDGPHRRGVVLGPISLVPAGSALAALPLGFGFLVAGRGLEGVGLGLVPPGHRHRARCAVARVVAPGGGAAVHHHGGTFVRKIVEFGGDRPVVVALGVLAVATPVGTVTGSAPAAMLAGTIFTVPPAPAHGEAALMCCRAAEGR
jgi:MFS family permease